MLTLITKLLTFIGTFLTLILFSTYSINAQTLFFTDDFETSTLVKWDSFYTRGLPEFTTFNSSVWLKINVPPRSDFEIQAGDFTWKNYSFSFDMMPKSGIDKNVFFRVNDERSTLSGLNIPVSYGLHITTGLIELQKWTTTLSGTTPVMKYNMSIPYNNITHIKLALWNNNIKMFINNSASPQIDYTDINNPILEGRISLSVKSGTVGTEVWFDNVVVEELTTPVVTPTPTATPTATTTPTGSTTTPTATPTGSGQAPTPTPVPTPTQISVPSLKQYTGGWENKIYAHTNELITQWGCALTSAAMVLRYHGHNVWPDTLNDWLKNQSDGYIRSSLINWLAVSRYTKLNDSPTSPTLEYKRLEPTLANLNNELANNRPAILKEPGHFIVATRKSGSNYYINDPGYNRNYLSNYANSFLAINSYTPTHSNLSYMMFVTDLGINLEITDLNGNIIPTQKFIEQPIKDRYNFSRLSGEPLSILLFEKPLNGKYKLKVNGNNGNYNLDSYLYNQNGEVSQNNFSGILFGTDTYEINYNSQSKISISISEILKQVKNAFENKLINNRGVFITINTYLKLYDRYHYQELITTLLNQIRIYTPKYINENFSNILRQNIENIIL